MIVREAAASDREFILSLARRFVEFELPAWLRREEVIDGTARQLEHALANINARSTILIADEEGVRVGFAWVLMIADFYGGPDLGKISEIAVAEDRKGIGSVLIRASEAWARSRGAHRLVLNVMDQNSRARRFYERHGFAPEYTMLVKLL